MIKIEFDTKECSTVKELIEYLRTFDGEMKVCGIGGGEVTITKQSNYPDILWFE